MGVMYIYLVDCIFINTDNDGGTTGTTLIQVGTERGA